MTAAARLSREEMIGLGVAVAAHVILAAALMIQVRFADDPQAPPERINVSLATDISLDSTAPDPSDNPGAAFAPEIAELPEPEAVDATQPAEATPQPAAAPPRQPTPARTVQPQPTPRATSRPTPTPTPSAAATQRPTGSRLGDNFLRGNSDADGASGSAATEFGPREQAALSSAITRQLKPHWSAPSGVDTDQLVTVLSWELNRDGSLRGMPSVVSQSGINASNRPQAGLHAERAIRAVQLAAPFNLPDQYYDRWRRVREWRFDRRL